MGPENIQIEMEARSDLAQKPYAIDVNMSYEDEHVNAYTNKASVSHSGEAGSKNRHEPARGDTVQALMWAVKPM